MTQHILTVSNYLLNPISEFLFNLGNVSNRLATSYKESRLARQTMKELHALNDKELNDIGIARGDIYYIAHHLKETNDVRYPKTSSNDNLKGWV